MPNPRRLSKQESDALMERMAAEFAAQFARIEQDLLQTMADDFRRGYHGRVTSADRHLEIARLRQRTLVMLNALENQTPAMVQRMIDTASEQGALAGLSMLQGSGWIGGGAQLVQSPAVLAVTTELVNVAQNATRAILPSLDQFIRRAVAETVPDVLLGMTTQKKVQAKIWQKSLQQGITHITDASGRRWNLATYVEMASRTATRRAFTESSVHQMSQHGVDLFTPVIGRDSCKSCAYWAGKILSTSSYAVGTQYYEHATKDIEVRVKVDATIDDARSQGWQHPNCRCQLVAYIPGLSVVADSSEHDPVREGQRVKLRELERKVRAAKTEELAAITPEQKAQAKAKVRDAQAAIRDHVEEADIPRRRDREQLNLGHKDKPPRAKPTPVPGPNQPKPPQKGVTMTPSDAQRLGLKTTAPATRRVTPPAPKVKAPATKPVFQTPLTNPALKANKPKAAAAPKKPKASTSGYMAGVPKLEKPMVWGSAASNQPKANPKHGTEIIRGNREYNVNCTRVATAMELRARGFDVSAAAAGKDKGGTKHNAYSASMWRTPSGKVPEFSYVKLDALSKNKAFSSAPEGARFFVSGGWRTGGAHIFNAVKMDGTLVFYEGQSARSDPGKYADRLIAVTILRTDNLKPFEGIKDWVEWNGK